MGIALLDNYQRIAINLTIKPNDMNPHIQVINQSRNQSLLICKMPTT